MQRAITMNTIALVKNKVMSGETIIEATIPIGMSLPKSETLMPDVAICALIDDESAFVVAGPNASESGLAKMELNKTMPPSAA